MYDAIVVGARCAGSPTAMLLARKGYRVLLVDKSTFPSDIMSTHYIQVPGVRRLFRWGLLDRLSATSAPPIPKVTLYFGEDEFVPPPLPPPKPDAAAEIQIAYCPRRIVLDKILVDAAVDAGAELREGFAVRELMCEDGRVTGIRGAAKGGASVTEQARIVIGADGLHSTVAKQVEAPEYNAKPTMTFGYYAYWSGVDLEGARIYFGDTAGVLLFPTNDGQTCIAVGGPVDAFHEFRKDIEGNYLKVLHGPPTLTDVIAAAKRETKFIGTADQPNFFRRPYGPGWALVGDAGYHRDFVTGLGIMDAFRDADLLAGAVHAGFSGERPLNEALAAYEGERNEIATPMYEATCLLASGQQAPPEKMMAFGLAMAKS